MQAIRRYILLMICLVLLSVSYFLINRSWGRLRAKTWHGNLSSFAKEYEFVNDIKSVPNFGRNAANGKKCSMETCFDFSRCEKDFKVFVYPNDKSLVASVNYLKVLSVIRSSRYYTSDPSKACIFVLSLDTLDRDSLSKDFVHNMPARLSKIPLWNDGQNHIIFNLYSGSWPDYNEDLGFDVGKAILAKASMALENFRTDFDISLPLFHKTHPERGGEVGLLESLVFPGTKKYLLAFKGKRYVYGIGSETRNSLYHLHNRKDIVLVTTCKHGESWMEHKDDRCDSGNLEYDKYDYEELLRNATFCMVPRGRRLGSFRFLEVLQAACIPVVLANGWELPFSEVIDWGQAVIWSDERLLFQVPETIRSINASRILHMRQQSQILWQQYFSSVERIVATTFEIVSERLNQLRVRPIGVWNSFPGALRVNYSFSDYLPHFPFYPQVPVNKFTAIIHVTRGIKGPLQTTWLYKLIKSIVKSKFVEQIVLLWSSQLPAPIESRLPGSKVPIVIERQLEGAIFPAILAMKTVITTDAIFSLDEEVTMTTDEFDFAFSVWQGFPDRLVGFTARSHVWDDVIGKWSYSSQWSNEYSIVLTGAAVYHQYWRHLLANSFGVTQSVVAACPDTGLLLNLLVADAIHKPPIKLIQRKDCEHNSAQCRWSMADQVHWQRASECLNAVASLLGYMPLRYSSVRFDPVLYKDKVSMQRKKYRQIETIGG